MARTICLKSIWIAALCGLAAEKAQGQEPSGLEVAEAMQEVLVQAIAAAEKSVVAIARVRKQGPGDGFVFEFRPDPFGRRTVPPVGPKPTDPEFIPSEFATGVVVDRRGLILTAYHVLGEDSDYYVTTQRGKRYPAWVKAADPRSDLAVLAIDAADLEPIALGDAGRLKKGQIVIALGNPYAIARDGQPSASWGIVSNLARKAPPIMLDESDTIGKSSLQHYGWLIQTDAKLNLGTSGGPLLNLKGQMVGLTTSLADTAGYEQAAGYAFPVDETFSRVLETLKQGREVEYGFLGVRPGDLLHQEILGGLHGARALEVVSGRPAERFGVKSGDIITAVNSRPIQDADALVLEVGRLPVGSVVRLDLLRDNRRLRLDVLLTKYRVPGRKIVTTPAPSWRGMHIDYVSAAEGYSQRGIVNGPAFDAGVVVTDVEQDTPAWQAGFRANDLVSHVDRTRVRTPNEFYAAVAGKPGSVQLTLLDDGGGNLTRTVAPEL